MDLKNNLKKFRKELQLTQQEVADKLNISKYTIAHWELGTSKPSIEFIVALSKLYDVSINALIGLDDDIYDLSLPEIAKTEEEQKLLSTFRALDPAQRRAILRTTESLLAENRQSQRIS